MRLLLAAVALFLTIGCAAATAITPLATRASGERVVFAVVTWNVHEGRGNLPQFLDDLTSGRLTGAPVSEYVILLQETIEGRWFDAVAIAQARDLFSVFDAVRMTSRGTSGNAILSTRPLHETKVIELPRERRVRKAIATTIEIDGQRMLAICAHFENRASLKGGGPLMSGRARERQAAALLQAIPEGAGFVGGDLNTWMGADEPALRDLRARFGDTPDEPRVPTFWNRLVLDHLFFDLPDEWRAVMQVIPDRYGSDHNPVAALVVLSGRAVARGRPWLLNAS